MRSAKEANSSKDMLCRIHWDLRTETTMRCGLEEQCTIAGTSRFHWFPVQNLAEPTDPERHNPPNGLMGTSIFDAGGGVAT